MSNIESKINSLETEIKSMDQALAENYDITSKETDFFDRYQVKKDQVNVLMEQWEEIQNKIYSIKS